MSKKVISVGLEYIKFGDIAVDGGMGTTLAALGLTAENTCSMTSEDPQVTEFFSEENDSPEAEISRPGKTVLNFSIMDANADNLAQVFGGTVDDTGTSDKWKAPATSPTIEQSIELKTKTGAVIQIPRASVRGKFNSNFSRQGVFLVDVVATILQPAKADEPNLIFIEPEPA